MTVSDWEGTSWSGTIPESRALTIPPPMGMATVTGKAAFGAGVNVYETGTTLSSLTRSPRRIMREAQAAYRTHTWIRVAERAVTRKVAGLPFHLEDGDDEEMEGPILDLLEQPQLKLPVRERQPGINSWRGLVSITSRHMGLCNLAFWYFDGKDLTTGMPNAILYINPARMHPETGTNGMLIRWSLDADVDGRNGMPLELDEVLTFYLDPPDSGYQGAGLYEAVLLKTRVTTIADQHATYVLGTGGRIPGIVAPKEGYIDNPDTFAALVNEFRNVNEAHDAAKRTTILRGPVDFTKTGGDAQELSLVELSKMNREDILTTWGVPPSQAPIGMPGGLNSGDTKSFDEAVLMQGSVHDRVVAIRETIQYGLLDRVAMGTELVIEEPEFDDETPAYERAQMTTSIALTRNERRAILGLDPFPDYAPDGEPLGIAIDMPAMTAVVGAGPSDERPPVVSRPVLPQLEPGIIPAKASLPALRQRLTSKFEPMIRSAVGKFLGEQRSVIAAAVRAKGSHLASKPKDTRIWWDAKRWDAALLDALRGHAAGLATSTATVIEARMGAGKADPFTDRIVLSILAKIGSRIKGINETTRDAIAALIGEAFDQGLAPNEVAQLIEDATTFDEARAELVARTETALAYNEAALESYSEFGVEKVEAIDGDEDPECAERNGQVFSLEDAMSIEDHPNGTLDWLPVTGKAEVAVRPRIEPPPDRMMDLLAMLAAKAEPVPANVQVVLPESIETPAPVVNVTVPDIFVAAPEPVVVNVPAPIVNVITPPMRTIIDRDGDGRITGVHEEAISAP